MDPRTRRSLRKLRPGEELTVAMATQREAVAFAGDADREGYVVAGPNRRGNDFVVVVAKELRSAESAPGRRTAAVRPMSDEDKLRVRRRKGDRLEVPRPINHRFRFADPSAANEFADAARLANFLTTGSTTTPGGVIAVVTRVDPVADESGELSDGFRSIREIAAAHGGRPEGWNGSYMRHRWAESPVRVARSWRVQRRLRRLRARGDDI